MSWTSRVGHLYRRLRGRDRVEADLDEEVGSFFETMIERRISQGLTRDEARRAVRLEFEGPGHVTERVRDARFGVAIETTLQDVRYAWRVLRKNPGFAVVAVLSLGLGLGANTAIFTLVNAVMLKSLPVKNADRVFFIDDSGGKSGGTNTVPYPCFERIRDHNQTLSGLAAFATQRFKVTIDDSPEQVNGQYASGSYFHLLGVEAVLGRVFTPEDDSVIGRGGPDGGVAVISYGLWERRFGRSSAVLGRVIQVGTTPVTIVGVTRRGFTGLDAGSPADVTIPMMLTNNNLRAKGSWWFSSVARLKDGVSPEQARAELDSYFQAYLDEIRMKDRKYFSGIVLLPAARGSEGLRRHFSKPLLIVMTIAGLVLLIGCANVANLLLARASARRSEIALRLAVGASRSRLVRQLLTEGLLLAGVAAGVGVVFARWGVAVLVALFAGIRGRIILDPQIDGHVIAFTAAVTLVTGTLFSIAPSLHATRTDAAKPGAVGNGLGNILVVVQVMLSLVLLSGAALFLGTLRNLTKLDAGFERTGILTAQVAATLAKDLPREGRPAEEAHATIGRMWESLLDPLRAQRQIVAVSASTLSPMGGHNRGILMAVIGEPPRPEVNRGISINQVTAGYFDTFGVALLAGRVFTAGDQANSPRAAILNESAVRRFFNGSNPVGRSVNFPGQRVTAQYEVVGVVRDTRYVNLRAPADPMVYVPIEQAIDPLSEVIVAIRDRGEAASYLTALRTRARDVIPGGFVNSVATVQQQVDESLLEERLLSILASLFGGLALVLAGVGLYGILSFSVIRRTREIGIRIAVGAPRRSVMWLVLRTTLALAGIGMALGLPFVVLAKGYIASELYGLEGANPAAISLATLVLIGVALAAGLRPAWRAGRLDPMVSLRQE